MSEPTETAATGIIKKWFPNGNYGFIESKITDKDIYFKLTNWESKTVPPRVGLTVGFQIKITPKRVIAEHVNAKNVSDHVQNPAATRPTTLPNPYHFIKLSAQNAVSDTPVWHDGSDKQAGLSGELRISLTALTPLLVGQWQYQAGQVATPAKDPKHKQESAPTCQLAFFDRAVDKNKSILEPMRLKDGRVVLPGTSIKGMIRNSLAALLSAPMERVAERSYSYRPNANVKDNSLRVARPAVIVAADADTIRIRVLGTLTSVYFVRKNVERLFKNQPVGQKIAGINGAKTHVNENGYKKHIVADMGSHLEPGYYINYDGGIDGDGELHRRFSESQNRQGDCYRKVWINATDYDDGSSHTKELPNEVIGHYLKTLAHLLDDHHGHFASGYPGEGVEEAQRNLKSLKNRWQTRADLVGRLIYVEQDKNGNITSMGHHYYYRWRYADTIRTVWQNHGQAGFTVRAILKPLALETQTDSQGKPEQLSAARLLFGYTSHRDDHSPQPHDQDGTANIGTGSYQRLAGRIRINTAVEHLAADGRNSDADRFVAGGKTLALKPLGQPRPSAAEHYLSQPSNPADLRKQRQDGGQMLTYGDLPALPGIQYDSPAELAGRKFYLHQPDAADNASCYLAATDEHQTSQQAMLARFVTQQGRQFRFTLHFKDLRAWELGALLLVLAPATYLPTVLAKLLELTPQHKNTLQKLLQQINTYHNGQPKKPPLFAHKLGHARPLGFGSVLLHCDQLALLSADADAMPTLSKLALTPNADDLNHWLGACAEKLAGHLTDAAHLEQWCAVHQYAGRTRSAYPEQDGDIFKHHSNARNLHIKNRRLANGPLSAALLKPLVFNPN